MNLNGFKYYVNLYGGYYDGILENKPVNVTGNTINIRDGSTGWLVYDDINKVDNGYSRLNLKDISGAGLSVNVIAGHAGLGEASNNTVNIYGGAVYGYVIAAESKKSTEATARERLHDNTGPNNKGAVDKMLSHFITAPFCIRYCPSSHGFSRGGGHQRS